MDNNTLSEEDLSPFLESEYKEIIMAENSPHITVQRITTIALVFLLVWSA